MNAVSHINERGRTTVPAAIRRAIGAKPGDRLRWAITQDGKLTLHLRLPATKEASLNRANAHVYGSIR
jgi:AbrB family looped-hinge helix DNA binding protein